MGFAPLGASQQPRGELHAPGVAQTVLPMCAGLHWTASNLVLYAETHSVWNQLRAVYLLSAESHGGRPGGLSLHTAWGQPDALCWSSSAEVGHLHLHPGTGDSTSATYCCDASYTLLLPQCLIYIL